LRPGKGRRQALPNERLKVRLTAWTSEGSVFESTELSGQPTSVTRADVVPGVGEGLSLMQVGEKARLWVPAALAFGAQPRRGRPAGDMVYDLELIAIE
jgi:FKBP-type peptidyl-prolyl cis-trans isomerase